MNLFSLSLLRPKFPYLSPFDPPLFLTNRKGASKFRSSDRSPMGANLCSFRSSCVRGSTTAAPYDDGSGICKRRRLQWWRREEIEVKKREKEASIEKQETKNEYLSLEELLLASPGASTEQGFGNGGKFNGLRHGGFRRKVHPTRICNSSSFCERSGADGKSVAEDEFCGGGFPICRSESGKLKKKVSFRLPEVSEVIVICSPEDGASADDANVAS